MTTRTKRPARVQVAAVFLLTLLLAGPAGTHVYWLLGGTWGLYGPSGTREAVVSTGTRVLAAVVLLLLAAAVFVVLARVGWWEQAIVSDRMIRLFAWALAAVFLLETLANFTWSREHEWWLYGPVALVIAVLALVVAGSATSASGWPFRRL